MKFKSKILLPFLITIGLFLGSIPIASFAAVENQITIQIDNSTSKYSVYLSQATFSTGSYSASFKDTIKPGSSANISIIPQQGMLEGGLVLGVGATNSLSESIEIDLLFAGNNLLSQVIYNEDMRKKAYVEIQNLTSQWKPGQVIRIYVSDVFGNQ